MKCPFIIDLMPGFNRKLFTILTKHPNVILVLSSPKLNYYFRLDNHYINHGII